MHSSGDDESPETVNTPNPESMSTHSAKRKHIRFDSEEEDVLEKTKKKKKKKDKKKEPDGS